MKRKALSSPNSSSKDTTAEVEGQGDGDGGDARDSEKRIKEDKKMKAVIEIAEKADWRELDVGYTRTYYELDDYGMRIGEEKSEFVEMGKPRPCTYNKTDWKGEVTDTVKIEAPPHDTTSSTLPVGVEYSGITMRQLKAVLANMERRCVEEGWTDRYGKPLCREKVNLYDLNKYVIKPYTVRGKKSFVHSLPSTDGPQPPHYFVSHWWGEPVRDFVDCLERAIIDFSYNSDDGVRGGGMSDDTPVWVCAYANNQWELDASITKDPKESGFTKAMLVAKNRTITILDKEGIVFTRIWCIFELFLTLVDSKRENVVWAVYTAYTHKYKQPESDGGREEERQAVGIVSGGSTSDQGYSHRITARETAFPYPLIKKSLSIKVESAEASREDDRIHILNSIVGNSLEDIDDTPVTNHNKYEQLNDSLRATFASSSASLRGAADEGGERWNEMVGAFSKGVMKGRMKFNFKSGGPWDGLTTVHATELVAHLPLTIETLMIENAHYGLEFMDALIQRVKGFHNLKKLFIEYSLVGGLKGGQEIGLRLANVLSTNTTIERLDLDRTDLIGTKNVEKWGDALMQNNSLTRLDLRGEIDEIVNELKTRTKDRNPELDIRS